MQSLPQKSPGRVPELDGIRGFALLLVLTAHLIVFRDPWLDENVKKGVLCMAYGGMDIFFVLSGFLIGGNLLDNRDAKNYYGVFYLRRALRIFPLYYLLILSYFLVGVFDLSRSLHLDWIYFERPSLKPYVLFMQNFYMAHHASIFGLYLGITWSLAVEEQFYALLPALVRNFRKSLPWLLLTLVALAPAVRIFFHFSTGSFFHPGLAASILLPSRWDSFFLGVLGAFLVRRQAFTVFFGGFKKYFYAAFFAGVMGIIYLTVTRSNPGTPNMVFFGHTLLAAFSLLLILFSLLDSRSMIAGFFRMKWLCGLGLISYCVFLVHFPVVATINGVVRKTSSQPPLDSPDGALVIFLSLAASVFIGAVSWKFFESRCIALGHSFKYSRPEKNFESGHRAAA